MVDTAALLAAWSGGGEKDLFDALLPHVRSASSPQSSATLYDALHALIGSTTTTTSKSKPLLTPSSVSSFIHKLVQALPSSSTGNAPDSATVNAIEELLIDVLWALDVHLDDIIQDAVAMERAKPAPQDGESAEDPDRLVRAKARRALAEADRTTLAEVVKLLLQSSVIQIPTCRARLDFGLLVLVGIVPNKAALEKKEVQTKTRLFYRQNKFNLLREQSEGYTKLSVELIASIGPPHNPEDAHPVEPPELIRARAHEVWDKVVSLVGYFDLDPNRVLDIILDVFSYYIITHHSFFLELLRCSPWAGASNSPVEDVNMAEDQEGSKYAGLSFDNVLRVARGLAPLDDEAMDVDEVPPKKASVCAQVLGFKFSHYQSNDLRLPRTFCLLAALLIRERFITLDDLLPHFPDDHEMKKEKGDFDKEILERISNARSSALALAAPLAADDVPSKPSDTKKKDDKEAADKSKDKPKEPVPNPRLLLLHALLALGALEPAYQMLSYAPWLSSASPEVAELLLRVAHHSLDPLYESTVNRHERYRASVLGAKMRYSASAGLVPAPTKKPSLTWTAPTPPSTASTEFVFFYPQWMEGIPVCRHHSDVRDVLEPMLRFIGVQVFCDTVFMTKLCRIAKAQICVPNADKSVTDLWVLICRLYLLPGMSLLNNNTTISAEIWPILRALDATARWGLYGEWATHMYKAYPEMRVRKVEAEREAKAIMRRLSTKTVMSLNRNVAKLAHCNPCVLFTHMVNQVQAYDNMAEVIVESLKFCALMPFDVLLFTVVDTLANPNKDRLKDDGISVSQWLQSLASFTGLLCRRYYQVDCSLILRYVVNRLRDDQVMEIIVLRELIAKMTGMQPPENLSEQQIMALSGGPILRIEAVASETRGVLLEKPLLQMRATERLMTGVTSQGLGKALLVLTARQRKACVFTSRVQHLKSLSTLFDSVQQVHTLFVECLATGLPASAYSSLLPSFKALCATYDIDPYTAMQIYRPKLHQDILAHVLAEPKESTEDAERRLKAALAAKREPSASAPDAPKASPEKEEKPATTDSSDIMEVERSPWLHLLEPIIKEVEEVLGPRVSDVLGAPFFVTFWQLSLYDLSPPGKRYEEESARQKSLLKKTSDAINDPSTKSARARELRTRKDRINASTDGLVKEYSNIASNRQFTLKRLATEKQHWFPHGKDRMQELTNQILQHCIIPRALISPMDADFCAHFIRTLHLLATPSFHTLRIYDKILNDGLSALVFSCTETEARNLGRFLRNILQDLKSWSEPNNRFLDETIKGTTSLLPGFQRLWVPTRKTYTAGDVITKSQLGQLLRKWHMKVSVGLMECVDGSEYMQIYNAIVILKELLPVLPRQDVNYAIGPKIHDTVKACIERETREDLKVLAQAYLQHLLKVKDTWEAKKAAPPGTRTPQGNDSKARSTGGASTATPAANSQQRDLAAAAPRQSAQAGAPVIAPPAETKSSAPTKLAFEGVPRPEVVKRVARTGTESSPKPEAIPSDRRDEQATDLQNKNGTTQPLPRSPALQSLPTKPDTNVRPAQNGVHPVTAQPPSPLRQPPIPGVQRREPPMSPRGHRTPDEHIRVPSQAMPPPNAPSSTTAAQDMRSRAARDDREREGRTPTRGLTPSSRPRSSSPPSRRQSPSRGNARNPSQDPTSSGPRSDDRYRETDRGRPHPDASSRPSTYTRDDPRDSRDRPSTNRARDDERTNDERFRERERHHHEPREREHAGRSIAPVRSEDENRGGDQSRRNSNANALPDDASSKRRRHADDEPSDRSSKRSSRHADKDGSTHRERDDRSSRGHRREKERGDKDKDRDRRESSEKRSHRKEREPREDAERDRESRGTESSDKTGDKSNRPSEPSAGNGKTSVLPPSGPRAMVTPEAPRVNRAEVSASSATRELERTSSSADPATQSNPTQPQGVTPSLRERLGGYQPSAPERNAAATSSREDTHGENRGMKRGLADRTSGRDAEAESGTPPHKRPKIQRQRYPVNSNQLEKGG